ncbi:MAG: hypothetical protein WCR67_03625 [Bacilli bacterium]
MDNNKLRSEISNSLENISEPWNKEWNYFQETEFRALLIDRFRKGQLTDNNKVVLAYLLYKAKIRIFESLLFEVVVKANDAEANFAFLLGLFYYKGYDVFCQNYCSALKYFSLAKTKNLAIANYYLGEMYLFGYEVKENPEKALEYFKHSPAAKGLKRNVGYALIKSGQKEAGFQLLTECEKENDGYAGLLLGNLAFDQKKEEDAFYHYMKGMDYGCSECVYHVGKMLIDGQGTSKNISTGLSILLKNTDDSNSCQEICHIMNDYQEYRDQDLFRELLLKSYKFGNSDSGRQYLSQKEVWDDKDLNIAIDLSETYPSLNYSIFCYFGKKLNGKALEFLKKGVFLHDEKCIREAIKHPILRKNLKNYLVTK